MFVIEDDFHAEWRGEFETREEAVAELRRMAMIAWDEAPNRAPCMSWRGCGRQWMLIDFDTSSLPWKERSRELVFEISAAGVVTPP